MRIALIEIGGSHDECLYSQIRFLKSREKLHVTLICDESLSDNIEYLKGQDETIFVRVRDGKFTQWYDLYLLWKKLINAKYDKIILNTAQGSVIKKFMLFPFSKKFDITGTLHNIEKLFGSFGQKIISRRMDGYFVLSDHLLEKIDKEIKSKYRIGAYYSIFYPEYPQLEIEKKEDEIWICIPGQVELKRRDYLSLFNAIEKHGLNKHMKFLFLGRCEHRHGDGQLIKEKIRELELEEQFMLWDSFIDPVLFYNMVKKSDYIMPLIHPDHVSFALYEHQISGAFNLGFGYRIPFLLDELYSDYKDFEENAVFYGQDSIMSVVNQLKKPDKSDFFQSPKWSFDYQKENYLDHIFK